MTPKLLEPLPDGLWVNRLRPDDAVWLVKEGRTAFIAFPWEPPSPGHRAGRLALSLGYGQYQVWYVDGHGNGLDGKPLVRPLEGSLHPEPWPAADLERRQARVLLASLVERLETAESRIEQLVYLLREQRLAMEALEIQITRLEDRS